MMDHDMVRKLLDSGTADRRLLSLGYRMLGGDQLTDSEMADLVAAVLRRAGAET